MGPTLVNAGRKLADAVKAWESHRSSNNTERMIAAANEYRRLLEIAG